VAHPAFDRFHEAICLKLRSPSIRVTRRVDSWSGPKPSDEPLQQLPELFRAQAGISHNAAHGMSVNRIMSWDL
jgi:hypothetical protein